MREVDELLGARRSLRKVVYEAHPELAFARMNRGRPVLSKKRKPDGFEERLKLLHKHGFRPEVERLPGAARDDILDAVAVCRTATLIAAGTATRLGPAALRDSRGLTLLIVEQSATRASLTGGRMVLMRSGEVALEGDARELVVGEEVDRDELLRWLIANGYRREPQVEHRGDVAVRGDIVDVWLSHLNEPIRVELFGDDIERITVFDVTTQRSVEPLERCDVFPAREWQPSDDVRATAQRAVATHPALAEVLQPLCDGEFVDGMESWLGWLCPHASTLINVLEASRKLLVVDPERVRQRSEDILLEESELADVMAATWGLMEEIGRAHV